MVVSKSAVPSKITVLLVSITPFGGLSITGGFTKDADTIPASPLLIISEVTVTTAVPSAATIKELDGKVIVNLSVKVAPVASSAVIRNVSLSIHSKAAEIPNESVIEDKSKKLMSLIGSIFTEVSIFFWNVTSIVSPFVHLEPALDPVPL